MKKAQVCSMEIELICQSHLGTDDVKELGCKTEVLIQAVDVCIAQVETRVISLFESANTRMTDMKRRIQGVEMTLR